MKKKLKILFLTLAALFIVFSVSCTSVNNREFYVVGKQYIPEHSVYNIVTLSADVMPEEYILYIADSLRVNRICVDKESFQNVSKGDRFYLKANEN